MLESAYEVCLAAELRARGIEFRRQVPVPITYRGETLETGYRLDFLVEEELVVELKSVAALAPIHTAQTLTYLKLGGYTLALLINFNTKYLGEGSIRRLVCNHPEPLQRIQRLQR